MPGNEELISALREYDLLANVNWPLAHYKSAVRYLHRDPVDIAATRRDKLAKIPPT